jgi:hypothetical protein
MYWLPHRPSSTDGHLLLPLLVLSSVVVPPTGYRQKMPVATLAPIGVRYR